MDNLQKFCEGNSEYTPEMVEKFIGSCSSFACMAVMTYAHDLLCSRGLHETAAVIKPLIAKQAGQVTIKFDETDNTMRLILEIAQKDFKEIPMLFNDKYLDELQDRYHFCVEATVTYWKSFLITAPSEFVETLPADMRDLKQDAGNPISLYFDEGYHKRLVIFGCYMNPAGQMLMKR